MSLRLVHAVTSSHHEHSDAGTNVFLVQSIPQVEDAPAVADAPMADAIDVAAASEEAAEEAAPVAEADAAMADAAEPAAATDAAAAATPVAAAVPAVPVAVIEPAIDYGPEEWEMLKEIPECWRPRPILRVSFMVWWWDVLVPFRGSVYSDSCCHNSQRRLQSALAKTYRQGHCGFVGTPPLSQVAVHTAVKQGRVTYPLLCSTQLVLA